MGSRSGAVSWTVVAATVCDNAWPPRVVVGCCGFLRVRVESTFSDHASVPLAAAPQGKAGLLVLKCVPVSIGSRLAGQQLPLATAAGGAAGGGGSLDTEDEDEDEEAEEADRRPLPATVPPATAPLWLLRARTSSGSALAARQNGARTPPGSALAARQNGAATQQGSCGIVVLSHSSSSHDPAGGGGGECHHEHDGARSDGVLPAQATAAAVRAPHSMDHDPTRWP